MRRNRASACIAGALLAFTFGYAGWLSQLDFAFYDALAPSFHESAPRDIIIVAVDEKSLTELGKWPWSRSTHATLTHILSGAGAKAIALDFIFADQDRADPQGDDRLIQAVMGSGRVILPVAFDQLTEDGQLIEILPFSGLASAAKALGHVDIDVAQDGMSRLGYLSAGLGGPVWPAYPLAIVDVAEDRQPRLPHDMPSPLSKIENPFVWTRSKPVLIPFIGPPGHFAQQSFVDVLRGNVSTEIFKNAYVLVGATAITLGDRLATPDGLGASLMSGVEFNANFVQALRQGTVISPAGKTSVAMASALFVLMLGLLVFVGLPIWGVVGVGMVGACGLSFGLLHFGHVWIGPAAASAGTLTMGLICHRLNRRLRGERAEQEKHRADVTLNAISDGVITLNDAGVIEHMNAVAAGLSGLDATEAIGRPVDTALRIQDDKTNEQLNIRSVLEHMGGNHASVTRDVKMLFTDGSHRLVQLSVIRPGMQSDAFSGSVITVTDKTNLHRMAQVIAQAATRDDVTSLPNRKVFLQQLSYSIARAQNCDGALAVIVIDVDRFQNFNNTFGYDAGDTLLRSIAERLQGIHNGGRALARIDADSFALFVEGITINDRVLFQAHRLRKAIHRPFSIHGFHASVTASIGVSFFAKDSSDTDTLLANAESAVLKARHRGGNAVEFFPGTAHVYDLKTAVIKRRIKNSVKKSELELHYQPLFDLTKNRVCGVEALLRWNIAKYWTIFPGDFLHYIEEYGMTEIVGDFVTCTALNDINNLRRIGWNEIRISVNLTLQQLLDPDFPRKLCSQLQENKIDGRLLVLEIAESYLIKDFDRAIKNIKELSEAGVEFYIDDFGVGYTSLAYLKKLPVHGLKIDKSFVQSAVVNEGDHAVFAAIIVIARAMNLRVVAEGIETQQQADFVRKQSCDEAQGFFISEALPLPRLLAYLKASDEQDKKASAYASLTS